jgi:hypothetical protein
MQYARRRPRGGQQGVWPGGFVLVEASHFITEVIKVSKLAEIAFYRSRRETIVREPDHTSGFGISVVPRVVRIES